MVLATAAVLGITAAPSAAKVLCTRDSALVGAFGRDARTDPRTAYLTEAQVDSVRRLARTPFDTLRLTYWVASRGDSLLGYAYLDTHPVRSLLETVFVAVSPHGRVLRVDVLAFHEPEDYLPPRRWFDRLAGFVLSPRLRPGDHVDGLSGATLSARAATGAVRRALALHAVLQGSAR
jgi:hypothetical protein